MSNLSFSDTAFIDWAAEPKLKVTDLPRPVGWRLLVVPMPVVEKSKGGVILLDTSKENQQLVVTVGRVVLMGDLAYTRDDMLVNGKQRPWCGVGDLVIYGKYAGKKIKYNGTDLVFLNDDEIIATISKA